ncbi:hypothetical protein LTR29_012369 [Friedmanniomyces endolithicus]|nr:hypothetical protein LTR29_012369 [Friedmanniomyces endolithicus]
MLPTAVVSASFSNTIIDQAPAPTDILAHHQNLYHRDTDHPPEILTHFSHQQVVKTPTTAQSNYNIDGFTLPLAYADTFDLRDKNMSPTTSRCSPMVQNFRALMAKVKAGCSRLRASTREWSSPSGSQLDLLEMEGPEKSSRQEAEELVALWSARRGAAEEAGAYEEGEAWWV